MTTVTVIPNPQDKSNTEALLYWVGARGTLAAEHRVLGSTGYTPYTDNTAPKWAGPITIPGQIAAVAHDKSTTVYGFTRTFDSDGNIANYLAQISPVINPFSSYNDQNIKKQSWNALAATTDDHDYDYVYIFRNEKNPADPANPNPVIVEFSANVSGGLPTAADIDGVPSEPFPTAKPLKESQLAAIWEDSPNFGKRRTVFYQRRDDDGNRIWYQHAGSESPEVITDTYGRVGTSIAVVTVPKTDDYTKDVVYLYFIDLTHQLRRVTRIDDNWKAPAIVENGTNIAPQTGLTAIWDENKQSVRVFAQTTDAGDAFTQIDDAVANRV